jgi:ribosomal protein S18 acetylase RimI-like enzyme
VDDIREDLAELDQIADSFEGVPRSIIGNLGHKASVQGLSQIPTADRTMSLRDSAADERVDLSRAILEQTPSNKITSPRFGTDNGVGYVAALADSRDVIADAAVVELGEQLVQASAYDFGRDATKDQGLTLINEVMSPQFGVHQTLLSEASRKPGWQSTLDSLEPADSLMPADWRVLREARLEALLDSPHAFISSHACESEWGELEWRRLFDAATWVVVRETEKVVGLARSVGKPTRPRARHLESIWIAPTHRQRGVFRALLHAIAEIEHRNGVKNLLLWVFEDNGDAIRAYEALGFAPTGERKVFRAFGRYERRFKLNIKRLLETWPAQTTVCDSTTAGPDLH